MSDAPPNLESSTDQRSLRVLIVEDSEFDAAVLANTLTLGGYQPDWICVDSLPAFADALKEGETWDVILSDYNLPTFKAPDALRELQASGLDIPFIIISGGIGEDTAVAAMKAGAHDYLMKGRLTRLAPAVEREVRDARARKAAREAEAQRRDIERRYRLLWEHSIDAVVLFDNDRAMRMINPAAERMFGYDVAELVGRSVSDLFRGGPDSESEDPHLGETIGTPAGSGGFFEAIAYGKDGRRLLVEFTVTEFIFEEESHGAFFIRDVSARKVAELELRKATEQFRVAHEVQQRLFPAIAPQAPGFDIAGASFPAEETGGDHFDYLAIADGSIGLVVADVTGHGVGPALLMAETRAYLRIVARNREDLGQILTRTNLALEGDLDFERYITALLVKLDVDGHRIQFVNAGHSRGFVLDGAGSVRCYLERSGPPLGIRPDLAYTHSDWVDLEVGDTVLLVTDGIEEAEGPNGDFFEEQGLLDAVRSLQGGTARDMIDAVKGALLQFAAAQSDDWTLIVARYLGS